MNTKHALTIFVYLTLLILTACSGIKPTSGPAVSSDGNTIQYEVHGNSGQTLLFVHGWSNTMRVWDAQINEFSKSNTVVTVDLTGFGKSTNNREDWSMNSFGEDVAAVIRLLDLKNVILVGFSMGGPVSLETARQAPDRIQGIVLVDILQDPDHNYPDDQIESFTTEYMDSVTKPTIEKIRPFFRTRGDELGRKYITMVKDVPKAGWEDSLRNCLYWINTKAAETIQGLSIPVVAINSDQYPTNVNAFRKYNPMFQARIIKGVNHVVFWEDPDQFNRYLDESIQDIVTASSKQSHTHNSAE